MPTGRLVLRAYSPVYDTAWSHEWTEATTGDLASMATQVADLLKKAVPFVEAQIAEADEGEAQRRKEADRQHRRWQAERRVQEHQKAATEAREQLLAIVDSWNTAFAVEAFFEELNRRASPLEASKRDALQVKIAAARTLFCGPNAIERFLNWKPVEAMPADSDHDP